MADGAFGVSDRVLGSEELLVDSMEKPGWTVVSEDGVTLALDTALDDELRLEARVYETIHRVNTLREDTGMALEDRIALAVRASDADLLRRAEWLKAETLAVELGVSEDDEERIVRVADGRRA